MHVVSILRPNELPFPVPEDLATSIQGYVDSLENNNDEFLDCWLDEIEGGARMLPDDQDTWIRNYYVLGAWKDGNTNRAD